MGYTKKRLAQTGKTTVSRDRRRAALAPGRRVSRTGKPYTETRRNRSDRSRKRRL